MGIQEVLYKVKPADIVLSRFHGKNGWKDDIGRMIGRAITWIPGVKSHTGYSHAMIFGPDLALISAEQGAVRKVDLAKYLGKNYSIAIYRFDHLSVDVRKDVAKRAQALIGTGYSMATIVAHGVDTLLTVGGLAPHTIRRPVATLIGMLDPKLVCSETDAQAYWEGARYLFTEFEGDRKINPAACRPRDIEWTATQQNWQLIHRTDRGVEA